MEPREASQWTTQAEEAYPHTDLHVPTTPPGIRGPRSRIAIAILLLLYAKPMRSAEIAQLLRKSSKYVSSYLSYWKSRGYVTYSSGYWFLTKRGEDFAKMILALSKATPIISLPEVVQLAHQLMSEQVAQTINNKTVPDQADIGTVIQQFIVDRTNHGVGVQTHLALTPIQRAVICLDKILSNKDLLEDEMYILKHLVRHYIEWGSTYKYLDQLAEELHYDTRELMLVLRRLQSKKLIYIYTDRKFGIRIGLGKTLKQLLDTCMGSTFISRASSP